jgi:glycosyltransferase involved in cell wall biosynthesis
VTRRPRAVWLLDSEAPTGATVMSLRRMRVLRDRLSSSAFSLLPVPGGVPAPSAYARIPQLSGLAAEVRIARAALVVTGTARTLAAAAPRLTGRTRLVHFLNALPDVAFANDLFTSRLTAAAVVVVPLELDPGEFARKAGIRREQVVAMDDFTVPEHSLLGTARARTILAADSLTDGAAAVALAEGFRLALPKLPGWQLRIAGWGPGLDALVNFVDRHQLAPRVLALGAQHDLAPHYLDAGLVVRIGPDEANGLSVLEALAAGVPVLGSESIPAVRRHVRHDVNGWVLDRTDPPAIAEAFVALADPARRERLGAAARTSRTGLVTAATSRQLYEIVDAALSGPERSAL